MKTCIGSLRRWRVGALAWAALLSACASTGQPTVVYQAGIPTVASGESLTWTFDSEAEGGLPAGAEAFTGSWTVQVEADAPSAPNALCQTGNATFPALVLGDNVYADVVIAAAFKPISGNTDRAAGIIFRIQDANNFYILRANALEQNVNLYTYVSGQRSSIKEGRATVASGEWQMLKVEAKGNALRGYLNDQLVVEAQDDTFSAGRVGLWTKADSVTCFDDVQTTVP